MFKKFNTFFGKIFIFTVIIIVYSGSAITMRSFKYFSNSLQNRIESQLVQNAELSELLLNESFDNIYAIDAKVKEENISTLLLDSSGNVILSSDESRVSNLDFSQSIPNFYNEVISNDSGTGYFTLDNNENFAYYKSISGEDLYLVTYTPVEIYMAEINSLRTRAILILLACILFGVMVSYFFSKSFSKPVSKIVDYAEDISKGELDKELPQKIIDREDEIGELAKALNVMTYNLKDIIQEITTSSKEVTKQSGLLTKISNEINQSSEEISATMEEMSAGVEEQANSIDNMSYSINELDNLIKEGNSNADILKDSSKDILDITKNGNNQMNDSIDQMIAVNEVVKGSVEKIKGLDRKTEDISKLVQVVDDISGQTNLLALNAAIEAARAGEAGKGFSVVAEEIRKLAEMVGQSLSQITEIVEGIQKESKEMTLSLENGYKEVSEGTNRIKNTGQTFKKINSEIINMNEKIENIALNLQDIDSNSTNINKTGESLVAISQENSAGIEETTASIDQQNEVIDTISKNAKSLDELSSNLNPLISQFKV